MLKDKTFRLNGTNILTPLKWTESFENVETVKETEAGTTQVMIIRHNRRTVEAQFRVTSNWLHIFAALNTTDSVHAEYYDIITGQGVDTYMRISNFKSEFIYHSEKSTVTDGVYNVSFTLEEI